MKVALGERAALREGGALRAGKGGGTWGWVTVREGRTLAPRVGREGQHRGGEAL